MTTERVQRGVMPRIGEKAPDFEAITTHGPVRLSEFRGDWLVFFSHPADFTPVCTTEMMAFTDDYPEFQKRGVRLMGLSVDGVQAHIGWVRNIEEKTGKAVPFPIIADLSREVAYKYGMVHPAESQTETIRAIFIIDPQQTIRAIIYYPLTTGRNTEELLRVIDSLQTVDRHNVVTPANWHPGEKVIVPPPATQEAAKARLEEKGLELVEWYLAKKDL